MAKILKTICAYGNNYYDNDIQYIFLGVEEVNDENNKAIPKPPILGIDEGNLEKYMGLRVKPKKSNKLSGIHIIHPVQNTN